MGHAADGGRFLLAQSQLQAVRLAPRAGRMPVSFRILMSHDERFLEGRNVPSDIRRKKSFCLAFHTGRATARAPAANEIRVSRPLRTARTFFLHALV